jgi:hypothetical protein
MSLKDLRPALRAFLLADPAINAAVGGSRIYPDEMPQGVVAASIVYQEIGNVGDHHNEGPSGLARPRMQITAWAQTKDVAYALGLLIKNRLDGFKGVMGSGGAAVTVQGMFFVDGRNQKDDAAGLFGRQQDFFLWFEER